MLLLIPLLFEKHGKSDNSIRLPFRAGEGWLVLEDGNDLKFKAFYNNLLNVASYFTSKNDFFEI